MVLALFPWQSHGRKIFDSQASHWSGLPIGPKYGHVTVTSSDLTGRDYHYGATKNNSVFILQIQVFIQFL